MIDISHLDLPIVQIIDDINQGLSRSDQLIIEAPPGAGKTTVLPLSILSHQLQTSEQVSWLGNKRIILLEPRRIAARNAALRMANLLGENIGETVGYRMRGETKTSSKTRIEVITQGVLTRMLHTDPALESVGAILFDEFHERQLDSDLALSLCEYTNQLLREEDPIKLLVMSATLEQMPLERVLNKAETLHCEGRCYDVELVYCPPTSPAKQHRQITQSERKKTDQLLDHLVEITLNALNQHSGSVLVFLPGIREIKYCQQALEQQFKADTSILITPLYGALSAEAQQSAIQACPPDKRKIVLTTSIAETSLTIDGVSLVIDSGLSRHADFDLATGISRLVTKPVSRATATQRAGRAGRLSAGTCYRLWSHEQHYQKQEHTPPEIHQADLTDTLLQLAQMGITPNELNWLDTPPLSHINKTIERLKTLNAITSCSDAEKLAITTRGEAMAQLPVSSPVASMLVGCQQHKPYVMKSAMALASLMLDGDTEIRSSTVSSDLAIRVNTLLSSPKHQYPAHQNTMKLLLNRYKSSLKTTSDVGTIKDEELGELCALALPHRIAQKMDSAGTQYKLASGEQVSLSDKDPLRKYNWLIVVDVLTRNQAQSSNPINIVTMAAPLNESTLLDKQGCLASLNLVAEHTHIGWQDTSEQLIATQSFKIGCLTLKQHQINDITPEQKQDALLAWIKKTQLDCLPWSQETEQLQARIDLINQHQTGCLPDLSINALSSTLGEWLSPYLHNITRKKQLDKLPLKQILLGQLNWQEQQTLEKLTPSHICVPSGSKVSIDYTQNPPVIAVKLQEMFGCTETPTINNGKTALMIHLLSPARRPLQITQDLASFWKNGYQEVKKENKAKYAKHPWPDDPMQAQATRLTNRKLREKN